MPGLPNKRGERQITVLAYRKQHYLFAEWIVGVSLIKPIYYCI